MVSPIGTPWGEAPPLCPVEAPAAAAVPSPERPREAREERMIWPFSRKQVEAAPEQPLQFSQVDSTERFGDDKRLGPDDWIQTFALNTRVPNPERMGLPPKGADAETVYRIASKMSELRERIRVPNDGVYCPVCHVANVQIARLRKPCPKCGRGLLKFGWD